MTPKDFKKRAQIFKALGHPTRLFIVDRLAEDGPLCVCELTALVDADISTVSRHLSILKNAGLLQDEKNGAQVHYHLRLKCVSRFFDCVESVLNENKKALERPARKEKIK